MATKNVKSINLLPEFLRTDKNSKFLNSTIDQLIQQPQLERIDGFIGSKNTPTYDANKDFYLLESSTIRGNYQFNPALIINNEFNNIQDTISLDDLINEINIKGGKTDNLNRLFKSNIHSYNPHIDWDKLINYQEYYWLTTGPDTITITGAQRNSTSTFTVRDDELGTSYIFNPDGLTADPVITLYRGNTYVFDVSSQYKFYIKSAPSFGVNDIFNSGVTNNGINTGTVTLIVDENTPSSLFYVSGEQILSQGQFNIKTIDEDSVLNVESEIVGKKSYISGNGISLTSGMKIRFGGTVIPQYYQNKEFFVEGVGSAIKLIDYAELTGSTNLVNIYNDNFDATPFDTYPFDTFKGLPIDPEYITINRASEDKNPWSCYNRWIHSEVIRISALANGKEPVYPADKRAKRPIVEFKPNLKLYNFGSQAIKSVDLIDTTTKDAFNDVAGTSGFYVDGVLLEEGHRVIFNADTDPEVRSKIFKVHYIIINNSLRLELQDDTVNALISGNSVVVNLGNTYSGDSWWFNGDKWIYSQQHTKLNEFPLFDLFDDAGNSYSDAEFYSSNFSGNKIFNYDIGTGQADSILGFPLKYKNTAGSGSYLFKNYFTTEEILVSSGFQNVSTVPTANTYVKFVSKFGNTYANVWDTTTEYQVPILQFQTLDNSTSTIKITSVDKITDSTRIDVYINSKKINKSLYTTTSTIKESFVRFNSTLTESTNVLFKIFTDAAPTATGYYEAPINLTNNPLNESIESFTLSELSDHATSMVNNSQLVTGMFPGNTNLRDIPDIGKFGSQIVVNQSPLAFAQMFIGKKEHSVINALSKAADQYNQFKLAFLKQISLLTDQVDTVLNVDIALKEINKDKDVFSSYYSSDMVAYGTDKTSRSWTVTNSSNKVYPLATAFDSTILSSRSVLVYINGVQCILDKDYEFIVEDSAIRILRDLTRNDVIRVDDYSNTDGSFIPATPTKLGLYPKFEPKIFIDDTYANGSKLVIQGHDGSILLAYNDFRDAIILELEKRIYNNLKTTYNSELLDYRDFIPGIFRTTNYSLEEVNSILQRDFVKWAGTYNIDPYLNDTFDLTNQKTWNYAETTNYELNKSLFGSWRAVFNYFYDTDKPHTHPWEMLGFTEKPSWWENEYGPAPYTSGNDILWNDLELGIIKQGPRAGQHKTYERPGLSNYLPVNEYGELKEPTDGLLVNVTAFNQRKNWVFGDYSPVETSWRRSSYWPFAVQKLLALVSPAKYSSLMYDPHHVKKNVVGQFVYENTNFFANLKDIPIFNENNTRLSGYSVYISEIGIQKSSLYIQELRKDIQFLTFNLLHKVGGFVGKDKLQILVDSYDPTSSIPGGILPQENYKLILNTSNPIKSASVSGIIFQKNNGNYIIKGYDLQTPYFTVFTPIRNLNTPTITVGGISESFIDWDNSSSVAGASLSSVDVTTANSAPTGKFYQKGQIVRYSNRFYRVKTSHQSGSTFNTSYFQPLVSLPTVGGATVQVANKFDTTEVKIPYGTEFSNLQDVYDLIVGYGEWLKTQGFIFDQYNTELLTVLDWYHTAKEFLYWTTQNWANTSIITLSPFADKIKYSLPNSIVDNIFDSFYEYSILQENGIPLPQNNLNISRVDGTALIETVNTSNGIYFATINSVQKEHAIVFDNRTMFNDVIYDPPTGYRQRRVKLSGFRTANWNGDYYSPGFVYDEATVLTWKEYNSYKHGDVVYFNSKYYAAKQNIFGEKQFDFDKWVLLDSKPEQSLLPNFDYKINQFEDFYTLDIDNFDVAQQKMAQHLIGYTPRTYLNNIFTNPISQYKFYQGFIKEKGTKNSVQRLAKASIHNLQGELDFTEEWAFRIGYYGAYNTYKEVEVPLKEGSFIENPQILNFVDSKPLITNDLVFYSTSTDRIISPDDYVAANTFPTTLDNFKLENAGFARLDDVTATAYNENSLLDIANNGNIKDGDFIWVGFKNNGDWDVLRYTILPVKVVNASLDSNSGQLIFTTSGFHGLKAGQLISISQYTDQLNGVYLVKAVTSLFSFTVTTSETSIDTDLASSTGLIFGFLSARANTFDSIFSDNLLLKLPIGTKFWIDNSGDGTWAVYEKINNYQAPIVKNGWVLDKRYDSNILLAGDIHGSLNGYYGRVWLYKQLENELQLNLSYTINDNVNTYYNTLNTSTEFGYSLFYDDYDFNNTGYGLIFSGGPGVSTAKSDDPVGGLRFAYNTGTASSRIEEGLVKISSIEPILIEEKTQNILLSPAPTNYQRFGHSIYVQQNTGTKILAVGAPGTVNTSTGTVYVYTVSSSTVNSGTLTVSYLRELTIAATTGSQWGYAISGSDNCEVLAISSPNHSSGIGRVVLYSGTNTTLLQTIVPTASQQGQFGKEIKVSASGNYIFISSPEARNKDQSIGNVSIYTRNSSTGTYTLKAIVTNPVPAAGMRFGHKIGINSEENKLIVTALGTHKYVSTTFDTESIYLNDTTFDSNATKFYDDIADSGTAYVYEKNDQRFVLANELYTTATLVTKYGSSVVVDSSAIYVGANSSGNQGSLYQFKVADVTKNNWNKFRYQNSLTNIDTVQKITLIDTFNETVVDYLDVIDPLKGKIAGLADQELKYKSTMDPAVYSVGISSTVNDPNSNWIDEHVGELWWDLSTAKYIWYEQGDLIYRKNNWGKLFPGATIDVYEWVETPYLPSEWSSLADTAEGLVNGISGQPKYADNSVLSVKQIYNSVTNSFTNYYYYWVKNKVTVPNVKNRRTSSYQVSSMIADPTAYGLRYAQIIAQDSLALANIGSLLVDSNIHLNIGLDVINNSIPKHTEWLLLQEGNAYSVPNSLLEKKLLDSLLGRDSLGNPVPDPKLSERLRYGVSIRPRQTLFKNRFEALRNLIEFSNSVFLENQITGKYNFSNLNKQDEIPNVILGEYDQIVEDNEGLLSVDTRVLEKAEIACTIYNGKIRAINIINPGSGYKIAPSVKISSNISNTAEIQTEIDSFGRVINAIIKDAGSGFTQAPQLEVRPYTVIVVSDAQYNGKWTKFSYINDEWIRYNTQKYNTTLYWKYIDWVSADYNQYQDYAYTIDAVYQLDTITNLTNGQYIKIKNSGDGRFIIVKKVENGGTFSDKFDIVYSERGTIQLLDSLWDYSSNNLGFDQGNGYDQTLFDQTPDLELKYILQALKEDLFVRELKINWNLFFFKAVKYALTEQKLLDWAFKTSFINVKNRAGVLDQRPVYKLQNSQYYEDYLKEVKPYHTKIRSFTTDYSVIDPAKMNTTDFDLPAVYNNETNALSTVDASMPEISTYPWKSWFDNYTFEIGSISVGDGGAGYTLPPVVTLVTAPGDTGSGATAKAYIQSGKVVSIEVLTPGSGYKIPPSVVISGGGNTALTTARAYAQLKNSKIRNITVGMKFDRTGQANSPGDRRVIDTFICNGSTNEYVLSWLAEVDKIKMSVKLDGNVVLGSDYRIEYYTVEDGNYNKHFSKIVFLNYVPTSGQLLEVIYNKNIDLYNASERILNSYKPTSGMPGVDVTQLMTGMEYPKNSIQSLTFDYVTKWGNSKTYDTTAWSSDVKNYKTVSISNTATTGTSTVVLNTLTGISVGQNANIISYITNKFSTSTDILVTSINTLTKAVTFNSTLSGIVIPGDIVEFWDYDSDFNSLDSLIDGGTWSTSTSNYLVGALGINPEDIVINGDPFISENTSHAPEELVPGQIFDSLALNVYTRSLINAPVIFSGYFTTLANTTTTSKLSVLPTNKDSITVVFDSTTILWYTSATTFTSANQFSIDWATGNIIIPPQSKNGMVGYTVVSVGGGSGNSAGVLDHAVVVTENTLTTVVASMHNVETVKSVYVTVNGIKAPEITTTEQFGFMLGGTDQATVTLYNLTYGIKNTIQVWFFADPYEYFNEVKEQLFGTGGAPQFIFTLETAPGLSGPQAARTIVEVSNAQGRRRLLPPYVSYYDITSAIETTFAINNSETYGIGAFQLSNTKVYLNDAELRPGFDYSVDPVNATVTVRAELLSVRDVVAVVGFIPNDIAVWGQVPGTYNYDYSISGNTLVLVNPITTTDLRVITYTNHDSMLMRTERFKGNPAKRYRLSYQIMNDRYIWVQVNGIPLTSGLDYEILDDQKTVQIRDPFVHTEDDDIVIIGLSSNTLSNTILGYRIFNDIFNRTHFKRLSKDYSTYLTRPLLVNDTEIHVSDITKLTPPVPSKKIPGIVLIAGERIEFLTMQGNVLKTLRRGTLGTSPGDYVDVNTKVIDQSFIQTVPFVEKTLVQKHTTTSTTNTYVISTLTTSTALLSGDGIKISTGANINAIDQIAVYYGGRLLRKTGSYRHDLAISYDTSDIVILGTTATVQSLISVPTQIIGNSYIIENTNEVWTYKASNKANSINGYVYEGLKYIPPEFSISTSTQQVTLNLQEGVSDNINLVFVKKQFERNKVWNNEISSTETVPLLDSITDQAIFLKAKPAEMPDIYYYGNTV